MSGIARFNSLLGNKFKSMSAVQTAWCRVRSVDWENKVMEVIGVVDELEYHDVLLGLGAEYKKPLADSLCIIGIIGNEPGQSFLIHSESVEEIEINVGESLLHIKEAGFILKQHSESLKTVLNDMINEINKIIVVNGRSINVAAMNAIKTRLNKILIE